MIEIGGIEMNLPRLFRAPKSVLLDAEQVLAIPGLLEGVGEYL
jgi:hypothetical protein